MRRWTVREGAAIGATGVTLTGGETILLPDHIAHELRWKLEPEPVAEMPPVDLPAAATTDERIAILEGEHAKWLATGLDQERVEILQAALDQERRTADGVAAWAPPPKRVRQDRLTDKD